MSSKIHEIVRAVNDEIAPLLPSMSSEKKRIEMRANLLALEKMVKSYRRDLLAESKRLKSQRKTLREKKKKNTKSNGTDTTTSEKDDGTEAV